MFKYLKSLSIIILSLFTLTSCTTNPYTGEKQLSKSALFGLGGAAGGALVGQLAGKDSKSTLRGALAGGAVGAGYGYYRDRQEAKLRQVLQGTGVQLKRDGQNTKLIMPGNVTFTTNSSSIEGSFYKVLNSVAIVLKKFNKTQIQIVGYTDSTGSRSYNNKLSLKRANSVKQYLTSQGIASHRVTAIGNGPSNPIASNNTASGREANRRVEITLVPIAAKF